MSGKHRQGRVPKLGEVRAKWVKVCGLKKSTAARFRVSTFGLYYWNKIKD